MPRVVHFEIHASDPERAIGFYRRVFDWRFKPWSGAEYWMIETGEDGPGINGGLVRRRGPPPIARQPVGAYVCTIDVEAIDTYIERAVTAGGAVVVPKMAVPGIGWIAYANDSEGNIFGLLQRDGKT
jgi:predicted enzyme related to lactoylglutathione lyase